MAIATQQLSSAMARIDLNNTMIAEKSTKSTKVNLVLPTFLKEQSNNMTGNFTCFR